MLHVLSLVCFALLIVGAVPEIQAATAPAKIVIGFAALNGRITPLWAAKEWGFFSKNDIDADIIFVRGAPTLTAALLSGDLQAGYTGGTAVMGAAVGGADLKILAVLTNKVTYDLVARPGIRSLEELRGKQVGVTSIGGTNWMGTILGLERLGVEPIRDKINFIVAGDDSVALRHFSQEQSTRQRSMEFIVEYYARKAFLSWRSLAPLTSLQPAHQLFSGMPLSKKILTL